MLRRKLIIVVIALTFVVLISLAVFILNKNNVSYYETNNRENKNRTINSFSENFDSKSLDKWEDWQKEFAGEDSAIFVSDIVRKGRYALKINLKGDDIVNNGNRAELVIKNDDPYGSEVYYAWSFYIPEDYQDSNIRDPWQILGQWHHEPNFAKGETWEKNGVRPPTISLHYGVLDDDSPAVAIDKYGKEEEKRKVAFKRIEKGKWYDFIVHIKWSLNEDGFVEAWLNNEPFEILEGEKREGNKILGATMFNELPHFFKVGLYRNPLIESKNVIYIDEIEIGNSYENVADLNVLNS